MAAHKEYLVREFANGQMEFRDVHSRKLHRDNGPAILCVGGNPNNYSYWQNGELHRTDGPAVVEGGQHKYYLRGVRFATKAEWQRAQMPEKELTVAQIEALLGTRVKIIK